MKSNTEGYEWAVDADFARLAERVSPEGLVQSEQYPGDIKPWKEQWKAVLSVSPDGECCDYRVASILESARNGQWPLFVLQVGLWGQMIPGAMGRSHQKIYGARYGDEAGLDQLQKIGSALGIAYVDLQARGSLEGVWNKLHQELGWSAVMLSKCLHFMTRAAGWVDPVPVPIDNAMVRQWLWPAFKKSAAIHGYPWPRPGGLAGDSWPAYNRYMTAIRTWAKVAGWSCMDIEVAIFAHWRRDPETSMTFVGN